MNILLSLLELFRDWAAFAYWQSFFFLGPAIIFERFLRRSPWLSHLVLTLAIVASFLSPCISLFVHRSCGGFISPGSIFALETQAAGIPFVLAPAIFVGGILFFLFLMFGIVSARRLMFQARPFPDRESQEALLEGSRMMQNLSLPVLFTSSEVKGPTVWSWGLHPAVLLPESLCEALPPEERDAIFLHELAHISRRDHWAALLNRLCAAGLFWNPLYWVALKWSDLAADHACDLLVLSCEKVSPELYGETLLRLAAGEKSRPVLQYLSRKELLMKRIDTILDYEENKAAFSISGMPIKIFGTVLVTLFLVTSLAFCQEKKTEKIPDDTKKVQQTDTTQSYEKTAESLINRFAQNDFNDNGFTQVMKDASVTEISKSLWNDFTKQFGPFVNSKILKTESLLEFKRVHVQCEFQQGSAVLMVVVDKDNLVAGLFVMSVEKKEESLEIVSYRVDKHIFDMPEKKDFSTPETAYVAFERTMCVQDEKDYAKNLSEICVPEVRSDTFEPLSPDWANVLLTAKILSVYRFGDDRAIVVAKLEGENVRKPFNVRWFKKIDGQWLNSGNDRVGSEEDAKKIFEKSIRRSLKIEAQNATKNSSQARSDKWFLDQEAQDRPPHLAVWNGRSNMMTMLLAMRFGGRKWLELSDEQQKKLGFLGKSQELGAQWFEKMHNEQNPELLEAEQAAMALIPKDDPSFENATEEQKKAYVDAQTKVFLLFESYVQNIVSETLTPEQMIKLRSLEFTALPGVGEPSPFMFDSLDLSEEQQKKVEAIRKEFEPEFLKLLDEQMKLRKEHLILYLQGENAESDRKAQNKRFKEQEKRRIEFSERLRTRLEKDVLTDEQREKAKKLKNEIPGSLKQLFYKGTRT